MNGSLTPIFTLNNQKTNGQFNWWRVNAHGALTSNVVNPRLNINIKISADRWRLSPESHNLWFLYCALWSLMKPHWWWRSTTWGKDYTMTTEEARFHMPEILDNVKIKVDQTPDHNPITHVIRVCCCICSVWHTIEVQKWMWRSSRILSRPVCGVPVGEAFNSELSHWNKR